MYNHNNGCVFRKLSVLDLPKLKTLKEDSWATTHKVTFVNDNDQETWFKSLGPDSLYLICYHSAISRSEESNIKWEDRPIGFLGLTNIDPVSHSANISGGIFREFRGNEWSLRAWEAGTDFAFEMLNLHRINAEVLENNVAAFKMNLNLGYSLEGKKRKAVYKSGSYLDSYVFGMLREDWLEIKQGKVCNKNFRKRMPLEKIFKKIRSCSEVDVFNNFVVGDKLCSNKG